MANWPRTILPQQATWPMMPTGLVAVAQSGRTQVRSTVQVGRAWTETYGPLSRKNQSVQSFLAQVLNYWRNQTTFQIQHLAQKGFFGNAGATAGTVNGNGQTGSAIATHGWTPNQTNVVRAGDIIKFGGVNLIYDVTADANADASGNATISINPPVFSGTGLFTGASVGTNGNSTVFYTCRIAALQMPQAPPNEYYIGMTITFQEMP